MKRSVHTVQLHFPHNRLLCFCLCWSCQVCGEGKLENQEYCVCWPRVRILIVSVRLHVIYKNKKITPFSFFSFKFTDLLLTSLKIWGYFNGLVHIIQTLVFGMCLFISTMDLGKNLPHLHSSKGLQLSLSSRPRSYMSAHFLSEKNTSPMLPCVPLLCKSRPVLEPL